MKKFFLLALVLTACNNELHLGRDSSTPMTVEVRGLPVTVFRSELQTVCSGECGYDPTHGGPNCCQVLRHVPVRDEKLDLDVIFPAGSELTGDQKEKIDGLFTNDESAPDATFGTLQLKVSSSHHKYEKTITPVYYQGVNRVEVKLKPVTREFE